MDEVVVTLSRIDIEYIIFSLNLTATILEKEAEIISNGCNPDIARYRCLANQLTTILDKSGKVGDV